MPLSCPVLFRHCLGLRGASQLAALLLGAGSLSAQYQLIGDYNFNAVPTGNPIPTTTPGVDPLPQQNVYSVDGFPDVGPVTGTGLVQNYSFAGPFGGTMSNAAVLTTSQAGTGALFMDTQMLVPGADFLFRFDLAIITSPATGLPQAVAGAPNGQAFAINIFGLDATRFLRIAAAPDGSGNGGTFGYRLPGAAGDLMTFGTYLNGEIHYMEIIAHQVTGTMSVVLDGVEVVTDVPLVGLTSGLSEVFFFQNGVDGVTNQIALDNIQFAAIPEPATVLAGAGALVCLGWSLRRRRATTAC